MSDDFIWHGLRVGDWATWFSGIATFLAVCTALVIPFWQAKVAKNERWRQHKRRAQLLAIELAEKILSLRMDMIKRRAVLAAARQSTFNGNPVGFVQQMTLYGIEELPSGGDLDGVPYPLALAIASLRTMLAMYNGTVQGVLERSDKFLVNASIEHMKLPKVLDDTQSALARVARHLGALEGAYHVVDFFDRGDGTKVEPLPDPIESEGA